MLIGYLQFLLVLSLVQLSRMTIEIYASGRAIKIANGLYMTGESRKSLCASIGILCATVMSGVIFILDFYVDCNSIFGFRKFYKIAYRREVLFRIVK